MRVLIIIFFVLSVCQSGMAIDSTSVIFHFHGQDTTSKIGYSVRCIGDVNGDSFDDIAFTSRSPAGMYVFFGGNPIDTFPDMFLTHGQHDIAQAGDYTGDGTDDVLVSDVNLERIYLYKGYGDSLGSIPIDSLALDTGVYAFGLIKGGYVNNDSIMDLFVYDLGYPTGGKLYYYENPFVDDKDADWTYFNSNYFNRIGLPAYDFIDFNKDGVLDIFFGLRGGQGSTGYLYFFYGPNFSDSADLVIPIGSDSIGTATDQMLGFNIGDINGDNWEDLGIVFNQTVLIFCTNNGAYDYLIQRSASYMAGVKDVNGDGHDDLAMGAGASNNGDVDIYLGGPEFDGTIDYRLSRLDLPPLFLDNIGWRLNSAGDFNGDGYYDIIFACQNFAAGEPNDVFILQGSPDIQSDVEIIDINYIPTGFTLSQNYPNPFNPSTTIEFALPSKERVTLTVYNILGQAVTTLVDKELSAGSYKVEWNGIDRYGNKVASGVYTYRLRSLTVELSKQMVLVK